MAEQPKRLYRSQSDRMIAGVCGGIGEYFGMDPTIVRIVWVLFALLPLVPGILIYIIAWLVIPLNPSLTSTSIEKRSSNLTGAQILGAVLILIGGLWLMDNLDIISIRWWWWHSWRFAFPAALILAGLAIMWKRSSSNGGRGEQKTTGPAEGAQQAGAEKEQSETREHETNTQQGKRKMLRRSLTDKKLLGVCGGLGEYLDVDSNIIRVGFALVTIGTVGVGIFLYFFFYFLMERDSSRT